MTNKSGTVKLFTFSFEIDAPNIISWAPKIFSCAPKIIHLVAQVLPNSNLNFEPCITIRFSTSSVVVSNLFSPYQTNNDMVQVYLFVLY